MRTSWPELLPLLVPRFAGPRLDVDYELSDKAINRGRVTVEEVSEAGAVPDLAAEKSGGLRVPFLEGTSSAMRTNAPFVEADHRTG